MFRDKSLSLTNPPPRKVRHRGRRKIGAPSDVHDEVTGLNINGTLNTEPSALRPKGAIYHSPGQSEAAPREWEWADVQSPEGAI